MIDQTEPRITTKERNDIARMSEEFVAMLRQRVESQYYDQPHVVDIVARAILHSRGVYV